MEELKVKAIVLRSLDYKEKDKILDLFSLERGKITASLKGVRTAKSKLKFAGEILNLVEYSLVNKNNKYTICGASLLASFFSIATNFAAYNCACVILEILNKIVSNDVEECEQIFILTLKTFKKLSEQSSQNLVILLKFYLNILQILGFAIDFSKCYNCSKPITKNIYFSLDRGSFVCESCKEFYDIPISENSYNLLNKINNQDVESLDIDNCEEVLFLLNVLNRDLEMRAFLKIKSFTQLKEVIA